MNRRDFFKWASRLLAAIPFVALADLEPESEPTEVPFRLVPADGTIYTTTHPTGIPIMAVYSGSTKTSTDTMIADDVGWGISPTFQFWHEGTILWGSANNDDLSLKPVWVSPYKNST